MNRADLDDIIVKSCRFWPGWMRARFTKVPLAAVKVLDRELPLGLVPVQYGVLARTPNPVRRFLVFQVDIDRFLVGAADEVEIRIDGKLQADLLTANDRQLWEWPPAGMGVPVGG